MIVRLTILVIGATACQPRSMPPAHLQSTAASPASAEIATRHSIAVGKRVCVRTADARAACWGGRDALRPTVVPGIDHVAGVAIDDYDSFAWTDTGAVWWWATVGPDRGAHVIANLAGVVEIAAEGEMMCARRRDGGVACWQRESDLDRAQPAPVEVRGLRDAVQIVVAGDARAGHLACARRANGEVACWQGAAPARLQPIPQAKGALTISAGTASRETMRRLFAAVLPGERTVGWEIGATESENPFASDSLARWAIPALPADITKIAIGEQQACALGGAVTCWRLEAEPDATHPDGQPSVVAALAGAVDIAIGELVSCAHTSDGHARCWGTVDRLGNGLSDTIATPVGAFGLDDVVQLASGGEMTCARRASGHVACWGAELGDGTAKPVDVAGIADAIEIAVGSNACARLASGRVACWATEAGEQASSLRATIVPGFDHATALYDRGDGPVCARVAARFVCPNGPAASNDTIHSWAMSDQGVTWSCVRRAKTPQITCSRSDSKQVPDDEFGPLADVADLALPSSTHPVMVVARTSGAVELHVQSDPRGTFHPVAGIDRVTALVVRPDANAGIDDEVCALSAAGTVACWRATERQAHPIAGIDDATQLVGTAGATCVLHRTRNVSCWGRRGSLGDGSTSVVTNPMVVEGVAL